MTPKRRFWKDPTDPPERLFDALFQRFLSPSWVLNTLEKCVEKDVPDQTPKSPIIRCPHGRETSFEGIHDKSGFGDFGDCSGPVCSAFQNLRLGRLKGYV
jgi:hypothetical protein